MRAAFALLLALAGPAQAAVVASPGPQAVSVTVYRNPDRGTDDAMNLRWLRGFALITETRTVTLPVGQSEIRFEGVAGGILPQSAIVTGLPGGVDEKNRDARLLSPGALLDGHLGRRVHIRRTDRATGVVREMDAVVRAGPGNGVVLETADGIEALGCSGLPEALRYDAVPEGLSDKPTLAVTTRSATGGTATVTLSYLADSFDWQANYVAQVAEDGRSLDLFGWATLANGNGESFVAARTQVVAGTLNREAVENDSDPFMPQLNLACWPMGTTSDVDMSVPPPAPPMPAPMAMSDIVVTAQRRSEVMMAAPVAAMTAAQEELGDLKLYRIPEPVTVAANAMKQVALLDRRKVPFDRIYRAVATMDGDADAAETEILLRMKNVTGKGLGLPLPAGQVAIFEPSAIRPMLAGETTLSDTAIGQDIQLVVGQSPQVRITQRSLDPEDDDQTRKRRFEITLSNANPYPVTVEVSLSRYSATLNIDRPSVKLREKDGRPTWFAQVPANGTASLGYTVRRDRKPD
ncbi:DUF4139 domain-containing protein [Sphingomonas sp. KC8]|uniref:DUF4139 domain-containing protein n=1 Tax=Sphingomonas sp. KC8 TaxID=1030157 RepID=UPI000248AEAB|nr:hypothetical protein [Sphingomonas sp. KC8]ARS28064.1 hypothetical protein KC8_12345 [Sphingomonas sp. KC8]